jgi:hypothetical protein
MMSAALKSSLRHAATAAAGALGAIQVDPLGYFNISFGRAVLASLIGAAFAGVIRFLQLVGQEK